MILVKISSLAKAILHKCHLKASYSSAFPVVSPVEPLLGFSFLIICLVCCSCGSTKVVPIETIRDHQVHDTIFINNVQYDSIYVSQDRFIDRSKDTILIRQHDVEYRYKLLRDTIQHIKLEVRHDSIPYEVRITEVKEVKYIPPWCKWLSAIGGIALLLHALYIIKRMILL